MTALALFCGFMIGGILGISIGIRHGKKSRRTYWKLPDPPKGEE